MIRFLLLAAALLGTASSRATLVTFDMLEDSGTAGDAFENGASTVTLDGVTLGMTVATTLGDGTGSYSATTTGAGINSAGTSADAPSGLDAGETLTLSTTFTGLTLTLYSIDFAAVGSTVDDAALVSINGAADLSFFTGQSDFNGSSDVWTPSMAIALASGDTITITTSDSITLQGITFDVTTAAIPEPTTTVAFTLVGATLAVRRRRRLAD